MTTFSENIVVFRLSGGEDNLNPLLSLGGEISSYAVSGDANGLFPDLSDASVREGYTDHRCLYVFNGSPQALENASIHVAEPDLGESRVLLGLKKRSESQVISVTGPVFFGYVTFSFENTEFSSVWSGSPDAFASGIVSGFAGIGVEGVSVSLSFVGNIHRFTVLFGGDNDNKAHPLIQVSESALEGVETPSVSVSRQMGGLPINSTAYSIATPETIPANVDFVATSASNRLYVGTLGPGDYFPVWVKRATPSRSESKQGAKFELRVAGTITEV